MHYRNEIKFIISHNIAEILKQRLSLIMDVDANSKNEDNTYFIRSIYFDNLDSDAYYEKIDGIEFRKKYRIRIYNHDKKFIRLECKHKHNMMTYKESAKITEAMCMKLINTDVSDLLIDDVGDTNFYDEFGVHITEDDLLKKFVIDMKLKQLKPSVIVDYKRLAFTYPVSDVRITFDYNVKSGNYSDEIFNPDVPTFEMMEKEKLVLEIKFNEILPSSISTILSTVPMFRQAVSKFALCRSIK